ENKVKMEEAFQLVEKEKAVGLKAVTDGELRRRYWHLDFLASLIGVEEIKAEHWSVSFKGHQPKAATLEIVDKIDFDENSEFLDHFSYLKEIAGDVDCKISLMSSSCRLLSLSGSCFLLRPADISIP
ncbi:MAG: hypothetical protein ACLVI9_16230, partial [Anaerostipes hadrus]